MADKQQFTNPFADVELQPVSVAGETVPTRVAVRVKSDEGGWGVQGILGKDYPLLPNRKVRDMAEDIMSRAPATLGGFRNLKQLWDGKRYVDYFVSNNPVIMAYPPVGATSNQRLELQLGLMVWNAYDGTRKTGFEVFALNPYCTNQYHSRNRLGFFAWRHTAEEIGRIDADEALEGISRGVGNIVAIAPAIQQLKSIPLTVPMIADAKKGTGIPQSRWGDVLDALTNEESTRFGLFQAMTSVTSHKLSGLAAIATGTEVTEHFLALPERPVAHHTTAAEVIRQRV